MRRRNNFLNYFMGIFLLVISVNPVSSSSISGTESLSEENETITSSVYKLVPGTTVTLDASESFDPDGDSIIFLWEYDEYLSSYQSGIVLKDSEQAILEVDIPEDINEDSIILNLTVQDNSKYKLASYRQIVLLAKKELKIITSPLLSATVNRKYTYMLEVDFDFDNTVTFAPIRIPQWLDVIQSNESDGYLLLQGTPEAEDVAGDNTVEISVSDGDQELTQLFEIFISDGTKSGEIDSGTDTLVYRINSSADDAEEYTNGIVVLDNENIELVTNNLKDIGNDAVGLIFRNVYIPEGKNVTGAFLRFTVDEVNSNSNDLYVSGILEGNCEAFSDNDNNITSRIKTQNTINWRPFSWTDNGSYEYTTDLSGIVNEVISQDVWESGNSIGFIFTGDGRQIAKSFDGAINKDERPSLILMVSDEKQGNSTGISYDNAEQIKVYPNPTNGILKIDAGKTEIRKIIIYDLAGRIVHTTNSPNIQTLDISSLNTGNYILVAELIEGGTYSKKILKR